MYPRCDKTDRQIPSSSSLNPTYCRPEACSFQFISSLDVNDSFHLYGGLPKDPHARGLQSRAIFANISLAIRPSCPRDHSTLFYVCVSIWLCLAHHIRALWLHFFCVLSVYPDTFLSIYIYVVRRIRFNTGFIILTLALLFMVLLSQIMSRSAPIIWLYFLAWYFT